MTNQPDFIVDPSGRVRDVRREKYWRYSGSPPRKRGNGRSGNSGGFPTYPQSTRKPKGTGGVVVIPIGLIITIIVAIFRLLSGQSPSPSPRVPDFSDLHSGIRYYLEGHYDMALFEFNRVIDAYPDSGQAYNGRGLVHLAMGDYHEARADFDRTIELQRFWAGGYNNRGITYYVEQEYDLAIDDFDDAINLQLNFAKAYYNRGLVYYARGDYDAAIRDFDKAIEFTDEEPYITRVETGRIQSSFTGQNELLLPGGDGDDSLRGENYPGEPSASSASYTVEDYLELMHADADLALAYACRGLAYLGKGDFDQAAADLDKASKLGLDLSFEQ